MKRTVVLMTAFAVSLICAVSVSAQKYSDIFQYIRGQVPGVIVGQADAGATPTIIVRGIGTNSQQFQPLFVVDGLITPNIAAIDPENVYSIDVLKDAASCAIYGLEGGNGVIVITTKGAIQAELEAAEAKKAERKAKKAQNAFKVLKKMEQDRADSLSRIDAEKEK